MSMTRALALCAVASLALAACADRKPAPAAAPAPDARPAVAAPDAAVQAAQPPAPVPATKEARRAYRKHLAAGRKLAAASRWGEAVVELEAALAAIPGDGRALSELAWAAFNAGDHDKARRAGIGSVLATTEPKVKAASLYNLGRVEEAIDHKEQAARLYQRSLALRPHPTVADRLAGLGQDAAGEDPLGERFCDQPMPAEKICACIEGFASYWNQEAPASERSCELDPEGAVNGLRLAHARTSFDHQSHLVVAQVPGGWAVVATIEELYNPGAFGIFEEWELVSITEEALGARRIVKIVSEHSRSDSDLGIGEIESENSTHLTICVLGEDATATAPATTTRCPLRVPLATRYSREREDFGRDDRGGGQDGGDGEPDDDAEMRALQTPGLPIHRQAELRVDLAPDGTAKVVLVKGSAEHLRGVLGPHRLW